MVHRNQFEEDASWLTAPRVHPNTAEAYELEVRLKIDKLAELVKPFLDPQRLNPRKRLKRSGASSIF